MSNSLALPPGTDLIGEFRIERVLGAGGFGMTYLADEVALARQVTIKEYFPTDFAQRGDDHSATPRDPESQADFQWGLDRFIDEAQTLARFDHPHIVRVYRYFKAHGTAYMVLTFEEGQSLKAWLRGLGRAPRQRELDDILGPLLDALETIHAADFLHRDIAPDNIIIRKDGSPVLIDFGSARGDIARHTRTVSALVKPGYSPYEQYAESGARQGPWTDIYALGATLYHAVCGKRPPDAPSRVVRDELVPVREAMLASYRSRFLDAIERAINLDPGGRPQSVAAWRGDLLAPDAEKPGWFSRVAGRATVKAADATPVAAKTVQLAQQPGGMPPLPDAPGLPGQMLDYIEGLQQKPLPATGDAAASADAAAATPEVQAQAPAQSPILAQAQAQASGSRPSRPATTVEKIAQDAPSAATKSKPPRPRPVPGSRAARWRPFAVKFALGAGIAGAALMLNEGAPSRVPQTAAPVTPRGESSGNGAGYKASTPNAILARAPPAADPQRIAMLQGHRGGATSVSFTTDGRSVVTAGADATMKIWNAATGATVRTIPLDAGAPTAAAVEGRRALTGHSDGRVVLWDIDQGTRLAVFKRGETAVLSVAFARDGEKMLAGGQDGTLAVWDPATPQTPVGLIEAHEGDVSAITYTSRGALVATGGGDRNVRLWRAGTLDLVRTYRGHKEPVTALAFAPDGRYLAAAAADGRIRVWSSTSSSLYRITTAHKGSVRGLAFSPGGDILASAGEDGSVQLWQVRQSRSVRSLADHGAPARSLAFAPDGSRAAVASADGNVRFWDAGSRDAGSPGRGR